MSPVDPREAEQEARDLAARMQATRFDGLSGRVLALEDPETVWLLVAGRVDVQAVPLRPDGEAAGAGRHLFEALPGHMLLGTAPQFPAPEATGLALRGRCAAGTLLYRTSREKLRALRLDLSALVVIERWTESLAAVAAPEPRALSTDLLEADPEQGFAAGTVLCAPHGSIVWTRVETGAVLALGDAGLPLRPGDPAWPLTERNWITLAEPAVVSGDLTPFRMASGAIWEDLDAFGRLILRRLLREHAAATQQRLQRQQRRAGQTRQHFEAGLRALGRAVDPQLRLEGPAGPEAPEDGWAEAFRWVAEAAGIPLRTGPEADQADLEEQALAAGVAFRSVTLTGPWWRSDAGPLLGCIADPAEGSGGQAAAGVAEGMAGRAVALLPDGPGRYVAVAGGRRSPVTPAFAATLAPNAVMLYRPLPERVETLPGLLRFGGLGARRDAWMVVLMALALGLLSLLTPIATGLLTESVLPRADLPLHAAVIAGLAVGALGTAAFSLVQAVAVARVQARVDLSAQAALFSRLLRLPLTFFRQQAVGELANRAMGISRIRQLLAGAATAAMMAGMVSLFSGLLLFWYSPRLAVFALGLVLLTILVEAGLFALELPRQRRLAEAQGAVEAASFEALSAMPKLRAAAAEQRVFARWGSRFAQQALARRQAAGIQTARAVFGVAAPLLGTALLWAGGLGLLGGGARAGAGEGLSIGDFVAFQAAFAQFIGGIIGMALGGHALIGIAPIWERLRPILDTAPESGAGRMPVGPLRGEILASHVSFRYSPELEPALDDVTLRIAAGEYVALVGPSGSGKSTLVRLLLGLEQPQGGAVYVDGMDLATVDLGALRRQFGVVLQSGQLPAGSILEVILGASPLPESLAWEAVRQAGLEADIRAMPMGIRTVIGEGGGSLSGGQRQRLLIARALVRRPRILLFDEATSALDNVTQAQVKATLDRLNVTRIVVAHRLSTIRDVHRVIVLDGGRVVEEGGYDKLVARGGVFARLVARQLA